MGDSLPQAVPQAYGASYMPGDSADPGGKEADGSASSPCPVSQQSLGFLEDPFVMGPNQPTMTSVTTVSPAPRPTAQIAATQAEQ